MKARPLWTRYRSHINLTKEQTALVDHQLGLKVLDSTLGMRTSYVEALGEGLTVTELADQTAQIEVALAFTGKFEEGKTTRLNANIKEELHTALMMRAATEKKYIGILIDKWIDSWSGKK